MIRPSVPVNEPDRLAALRAYEILDTPPEDAFDDLAKLAGQICGAPVAIVSLVDESRQWFKARIGFGPQETSREVAFCAHGILETDLLIVADAAKDPRFHDNPLVTGEPRIRFYAGAPITTCSGETLGMIGVMDQKRRRLSGSQKKALRLLARHAMERLELRKRNRELEREILKRQRVAEDHEKFFNTSLDLLCVCSADGDFHRVNPSFERILGWSAPELLTKPFIEIVHPDDRVAVWKQVARLMNGHSLEGFEIRCLAKDGSYRFIDWASTAADADGIFAPCGRDVTDSRHQQEQLQALSQRLSLAATAAGIGVWDWDIRNNKITWDKLMHQMYGIPFNAVVNYDLWKNAVHEEDLPQAEAALEEVIAKKSHGEMEFRIKLGNGTMRHIQAAMGVLLDNDQNVRRVIGVNLDVTERKNSEMERERIIAEMQEVIMQVKTLSGLIPICGWCKSVRSDTGFWQTVEQYVRSNTSATFSHGICPKCADNFKEEIRKKNGN